MDCEILSPGGSRRGTRILSAMLAAAPSQGVKAKMDQGGKAPWLMSYGLGHQGRRAAVDVHLANGGRLIGWDLGYWNRAEYMRLTVDADHPQAFLKPMPPDRWELTGIKLRDDYHPDGPVVLVGLGRKSRIQLGINGLKWEMAKLRQIRAAYPRRTVIYRPKKIETLHGLASSIGPIENCLRGASLVVCRHSNVAVDACIAGVPVVCEDGAAAALYTNDLANPVIPSHQERLSFLSSLAYWNWAPSEAESAWKFLKTV